VKVIFTKNRKKQLSDLAREIIELFDFEKEICPETIAKENDIQFYYDNYGVESDGSGFEGLQIYDGDSFHTHINLDLVWEKDSTRSRFAFAHELGHFFIQEHHYELKNGYHPSKFDPKETSLIELEANYFARALLIPEISLQEFCLKKTFSLNLVKEIAENFKVNDLTAILRFVEFGTYPLMVAYCKNGTLEWFSRSEDFPFKAFKTKVGQSVPPTSVVGEYFRLGEKAKYTDVETIEVDDWFYYNGDEDITLNEQCFYSSYGYVISLIWPH